MPRTITRRELGRSRGRIDGHERHLPEQADERRDDDEPERE